MGSRACCRKTHTMMTLPFALETQFGNRIQRNVPLAPYTTFKIGGPADYFLEVRTVEDLVSIVSSCRKASFPLTVLGGGSNILISDAGVRGLVVRNYTSGIRVKGVTFVKQQEKQTKVVYVEADSGVPINKLVRYSVDEGLKGLHMHLGLPGSVGGAVYMNSKWTHPTGYVGDVVYQATIVDAKGEVCVEPQSYFHFAYDSSSIQSTKDIVVSVVFALEASDASTLWEKANESIAYRRITQPMGVSTAGCVFRNISAADAIVFSTPSLTTSAGYLIDHAGLKGVCVNDACVSSVHANFIVNKGKAKAIDVVELIEKIKAGVADAFGVSLTEEIERIGEF